MYGQPVLADGDPLDQARRHHPPADRALQPAEKEQADEARRHRPFDAAERKQHEERYGEDDADAARQGAVDPFPPENALELVEGHTLVQLLVLRDQPVFCELLLPFRFVERRDDAVDRLPFGDRQAGIGQPRGAADEHQGKEHEEHDVEPAAHVGAVALLLAAFGSKSGFHGEVGHRPIVEQVVGRPVKWPGAVRAGEVDHPRRRGKAGLRGTGSRRPAERLLARPRRSFYDGVTENPCPFA